RRNCARPHRYHRYRAQHAARGDHRHLDYRRDSGRLLRGVLARGPLALIRRSPARTRVGLPADADRPMVPPILTIPQPTLPPAAAARPDRPPMTLKRSRRVAIGAVVLAPALYFLPWLTVFYLLCGTLDIVRQRHVTFELVEKYFLGNGILTWLLSPLNLLADLLSSRNRLVWKLDDFPPEHRAEIETCVREFVANGDRIKEHVAKQFGNAKRA